MSCPAVNQRIPEVGESNMSTCSSTFRQMTYRSYGPVMRSTLTAVRRCSRTGSPDCGVSAPCDFSVRDRLENPIDPDRREDEE